MGMSFVGTLYFLYLKQAGLTDTQALSVNAIYFATSLILEVPTGIFADKYGRKLSINLGYFIFTLGIACYAFGQSYFWFALAELLAAIGSAFLSGALDTWLKSELSGSETELALLNQAISKKWFIVNGIGVPFMVLSPIIAAEFSFQTSYWTAAVILGLTFIYSLSLNRAKYKEEHRQSGVELAISAWNFFWSRPNIINLTVFSVGMNLVCAPLFMFWQTIFQSNGEIQLNQIGFVLVTFKLSMMLGNWIQERLAKIIHLKFDEEAEHAIFIQLYKHSLVIIACCVLLSLWSLNQSTWLAILFFALFEVVIGIQMPLFDKVVIQSIDSQAATSIRSLISVFNKFGYMVGLILAGPLSDAYGQKFTWLLAGIGLLAFWLALQFTKLKQP